MPSLLLSFLILGAVGTVVAVVSIFRGPSLVASLMVKYLAKRRIAWVALIAVTLCTTMVLVVISVMGGWLEMFKQSFHGLTGDIIIKSESLAGFPHYQEMIGRIEKLPGVAAAIPEIQTFGLINIGSVPTSAVKVIGLPINRIAEVNRFPDSLYRQHTIIEEELKDPKVSPETRAYLQKELAKPPSFALLDRGEAALAKLPADLKLADATTGQIAGLPRDVAGKFWYDPKTAQLVYKGVMTPEDRDLLRGLSSDNAFKEAVDYLFRYSTSGRVVDYQNLVPPTRQDVTRWPGLIPGIGVVYIHRDREGHWLSPLGARLPGAGNPGLYGVPVKLTVLGVHAGEKSLDINNKAERNYWIVDDSRTQIWQYDNNSVYVPFEQLQADLGMGVQQATDTVTGQKITLDARTSEIHIRMKPGFTGSTALSAIEPDVTNIVEDVMSKHDQEELISNSRPYVETWLESQAVWIGAVENEKLLVTFLFSIISLVAIFLIFCIFYMIVMEKTKDIGIIKSVGASSGQVAAIFLGYGLAIGIVGAVAGVLLSYLIVHNINEMHHFLGVKFGVQIWNPEVYLFDKIPNTMSVTDVVIIPIVAVLSSVIGALVPAIRAAGMNPVEALRWE